MLHIVFMVLKILGIILAIVLGILLVSVGIVLFFPVQYKVNADATDGMNSLKVKGSFSWFFHFVSGRFIYDKGKCHSEIRVVGIKIKNKKEPKTCKKEKEKPNSQVKKRGFLGKIKYTIKTIYDRIKMLIRKKTQVEDFLADKSHKRAWKSIKVELVKLWKVIKPKKMVTDIEFGTEDPSLTGKILAGLSILFPFYPTTTNIVPVFEKKVLRGEVFAKGHFYLVCIVGIIWRVFCDEDIKKTFHDIEKNKEK